MNFLKILLPTALFLSFEVPVIGQTADIIGSWQLVKQSTCLEQAANAPQDDAGDASAPQGVVTFKDNASAEESRPVLNSSRTTNSKKFFYKFRGDMLLILDKRSQTISDSYIVDKISQDSLIVSNAARPCETHIFIKINGKQPN